ncbi:MAG TPA: hypothetical protein VD813_04720 [Pseudonocardia sp.]|nr:hypothetical protein [Pseudonocardia sp.]
MSALRRILGRVLGHGELPDGLPGRLGPEERVLAVAAAAGGGHVVVTSWGLWLPEDDGPRRVGWHLVSRAAWRDGVMTVVEAEEADVIEEGGVSAVLLTDRTPRTFRLAEPGRVPETVQQRVEGSIRSRHHRELPGGGAWFVQRRIAGRDGTRLQVRPDPGTDPGLVRGLTTDVLRRLGSR